MNFTDLIIVCVVVVAVLFTRAFTKAKEKKNACNGNCSKCKKTGCN